MGAPIRISDESPGISLRDLATVVKVAQLGGVVRAARELGYAQSTVTLHVQNAERSLGLALFERDGRRLALTRAGRVAVAEARALLGAAGTLRARVRGTAGDAGDVALGTIEPFASARLPALLAAHARRFPRVRVEMYVGGNAAVRERLEDGTIDLALCARPVGPLRRAAFRPLFAEPFVVIVPRGHRFSGRAGVRLRDLARETLLLGDETCVYRSLIAGAIDDGDVDVMLRASFGSITSIPHAVAAKLGISVAPAAIAALLPRGVISVPLAEPRLTVTFGLLVRRGAAESPATQDLRALLEGAFGSFSRGDAGGPSTSR